MHPDIVVVGLAKCLANKSPKYLDAVLDFFQVEKQIIQVYGSHCKRTALLGVVLESQ